MSDYRISADVFRIAFIEAWQSFCSDIERSGQREEVLDAYRGSKSWTDWMFRGLSEGQTPDKGPLFRVFEKLKGQMPVGEELVSRPEDNKFDLAFVGGKRMLGEGRGWGYASRFYVLIEHENQIAKIEEEFWKMRYWRADLKVIISYAWLDSGRGNKDLERAIKQFKEFFADAHTQAVSPKEQYLFLYATRDDEKAFPKWHALRPDDNNEGVLIC